MPSNLKSKEFIELKKEWDKRLSDSGFIDIEDQSKEPIRRMYPDDKDRSDYYRTLYQRFLEEDFKDESERLIMELTADGKTIREISKQLKSASLEKSNKDTIRYVRRRYENKWGIRVWTRWEMVSRRVKKPATA